MVDGAVKEFGRIDYAVNCAGIGARAPAPIAEASVPEFQRFMDVNVFGMFVCTRALSRVMKMQSPRPAVPMGRIAQVDEIADVVLFLCSDQASYVTGSSWIVDGGVTLNSVTL
ncbi:MAG: hypothetical protein Q9228_006507 [Teloschistes exilis]